MDNVIFYLIICEKCLEFLKIHISRVVDN